MRLEMRSDAANDVLATFPLPDSGGAACSSDPAPNPSTSSDLQARLLSCIARIVQRDQRALEELYDATVGRVHGVALRIVNNAETAEEVVSDVYFQVWRDAERYDPGRGPVQTWLLLISRSRALDALRRRDQALVHPEPHSLAESQADGHGDLQDLLEAVERGTKIQALLKALAPPQRQLLALAFFRGYTHTEIASHLGMPLGSVKSVIRQALHVMRGAIAEG